MLNPSPQLPPFSGMRRRIDDESNAGIRSLPLSLHHNLPYLPARNIPPDGFLLSLSLYCNDKNAQSQGRLHNFKIFIRFLVVVHRWGRPGGGRQGSRQVFAFTLCVPQNQTADGCRCIAAGHTPRRARSRQRQFHLARVRIFAPFCTIGNKVSYRTKRSAARQRPFPFMLYELIRIRFPQPAS